MDITSDCIALMLPEFSQLQTAELEDALQRESLEALFLFLDDYDGATNLDVFLRTLENAPKLVSLKGTPNGPNIIGQFLNTIAGNHNIKAHRRLSVNWKIYIAMVP